MTTLNKETFNKEFKKNLGIFSNVNIIDVETLEETIDFTKDIDEQFENLENHELLSFLNFVDEHQEERIHISDYHYISEGLMQEVLTYKDFFNYDDVEPNFDSIIYDFISDLTNDILKTLKKFI